MRIIDWSSDVCSSDLADVGVARLAGTVDDAAHHRDLQRDLAVAEGLHGLLGHLDHVDLGPAAAAPGDQVDVLALPQAQPLPPLAAGPGLPHPVAGVALADRLAAALREQRGPPRGGLAPPPRGRAGPGAPE